MSFSWNNLKYKANYYVIILIAFFIPLNKEFIAPLIMLFFITSILNVKKNLFKNINKQLLFIIGFYTVGLLSLLYGKNIQNTLFNSEIKLSLIAFPISFMFSNLNVKKIHRSVFKSYLEGTIVAVIIVFINSTTEYYYTNNISVFFYDNLSYFSHVSYFSMYVNFSIVVLYYFWFSPSKKDYIPPYLNFLLSLIFSLLIILLASKTGIITMFMIHIVCVVYWIKKYKKYKQALSLVILLSLIISIGLYSSPNVLNRLYTMKESIFGYNGSPNSSTSIRLAVWKESFSLIKERPIVGYGVGDVSDVLTEKYKEKGFYELANKHLNSHNQYIQILLGSGIVGLLYFMFILLYPLNKIKDLATYLLFILFILLMFVNMLTESMLETQSGIIFFSFYISLFYCVINNKLDKP